ncbi:peptidylprolyl isomerase [Alkalihalophilus lindianensis]|uniref:Peptidyl-prolyl cis-trans isomerase n=1 Tax=Alkalihalophilus lindianensis TaxID=1630542 RepID=A0ABU3XF88_9BACI|nr:peptidylprolyl isomerase [Alkalihalophilus lindianensis]MDV2686566.1 peptidylprolyl isomerase [Alkalihalophilus lindianensis]
MKKTVLRWSFLMIALMMLVACGQANDEEMNEEDEQDSDEVMSETGSPIVTMEMENGGEVLIELYPDVAPKTVENFVSLVEEGFYDGLTFHRVIPGFMIQGGDPDGNGTGGPGYSIEGEFSSNGFENDLKHDRGVISMARSQDPNSGGSQFFIMVAETPSLDGEYASFGKVIEGMDVVDEIVAVETVRGETPVEGQEQIIKQMTVEVLND